jgi:hypothetical protein
VVEHSKCNIDNFSKVALRSVAFLYEQAEQGVVITLVQLLHSYPWVAFVIECARVQKYKTISNLLNRRYIIFIIIIIQVMKSRKIRCSRDVVHTRETSSAYRIFNIL